MALSHSIRAAVLVAATASGAAPQTLPAPTGTSNFAAFLRGVQIGTEEIAAVRGADGWTVSSNGRIGAPIDLVNRNLQIRYDADWKARELTLDATVRGQELGLRIIITGTTATTHVNNAGQNVDRTDTVATDVVLLPNPFFAAYQAVAARLKTAAPGDTIPAYPGGPVAISILVGKSESEKIQTVSRLIDARRTRVTLSATGQPALEAEIWGDEAGRLLRVSVPAQSIEFIRDDVASVSTRRVVISREGDEQARIPANGFNLMGTIAKPAGAAGKRPPAIVLVGGSGVVDRDGTAAGIPVYGQLAHALADAGFLVLRYDKRGTRAAGGSNAGFIRRSSRGGQVPFGPKGRRSKTDRRGRSQWGTVTLLAAEKDRRIATIVLAVPGVSSDLAAQRSICSTAEALGHRQAERIDLQKRIHEAVITGKLEALPAGVRRQIDNVEFHSILTHDPAKILPNAAAILIVQGMLDTEVD
jgi:hypothetical protein